MPFTLPLDEMTVEEKLQAMDAIWASLSRSRDEIESPAWHGEVLRERQREVAAGEAEFLSWEEAQEEVDRLVAQSDEAGIGA